MIKIGLVRERKDPADNRVAFAPEQCKYINQHFTGVQLVVESSPDRCFSDREYAMAGISVTDDVSDCDILVGIKEIPPQDLIAGKKYMFFSHTKKQQPHNQGLLQEIIKKNITLIDYEALEHEDGKRIIGFGFFAGVVGAHNGMWAYGNRTGAFTLSRVYQQKSFKDLIHTYFGLKIPPIKIAVTGSGRVAHGILEIMNLMGVHEAEPDEYLSRDFSYPVYVQLKGHDLYEHAENKTYSREHFHGHPQAYRSRFLPYAQCSDILLNGVYWEQGIPRLFEKTDVRDPAFRIQVIADITDDANGSVPINMGDKTIEDPVYGVDRNTLEQTSPYLPGSIDVMAVGNLPNELPRDASRYFGEQLLKYVMNDLLTGSAPVIDRATIVCKGQLTAPYKYLHDYAYGTL